MAGHLPIPVYALMVVCAFFGWARKAPESRPGTLASPRTLSVALAIAAIFFTRFIIGAWFDPQRDGDIGWQQWLGLQILHTGAIPHALGPEAFTATGAPWVPQEWALSVLIALTVGTPLFLLIAGLAASAALATLTLTALGARAAQATTVATGLVVACVGLSMLESFGIRAQVFGWALLAAFMYLLRCASPGARWWCVPLVIVWANLHASAMIAPVILALWTMGTAIDERGWNRNFAQLAVLTLACAAGVFLTPLGYRLPFYAAALLNSPIRNAINEWQPSDLGAISFTFGALPLIVAACVLGVERAYRWRQTLLFAAVTWLAFTAVRNVPVCAIVLAVPVAVRLSAYITQRSRANTIFEETAVRRLFYGGAALATVLATFALVSSPQFRSDNLPAAAIATLGDRPGMHNLYCEDFAWCSLALKYPNVREFIDGRCDPFPLHVWKDYETVYSAKGSWRQILERHRVNAIVVEKNRALAAALPKWSTWRLVYADNRYRLFVRS